MQTMIVKSEELTATLSLQAEDYCGREQLLRALQSIFYDLAKAVPIGTLNQALLNTIPYQKGKYTDTALSVWAFKYAKALMTDKNHLKKEGDNIPPASLADLRVQLSKKFEEAGLEVAARSGRSGSRYLLRRSDGNLVRVMSCAGSKTLREGKGARDFSVGCLGADDFSVDWFVFLSPYLEEEVLFSFSEVTERFLRKGKEIPQRTSLTITSKRAQDNSWTQRIGELVSLPKVGIF